MERWVEVREALPEAMRFFAIFSRLDFALKHQGYIQRHINGALVSGRPLADWNIVVRAAEERNLFEKLRLDAQVRKFISHPPKEETARLGGGIYFQEPDPIENMGDLLSAVRRARDNLYHGGDLNGTERGRETLLGAIAVLEAVLQVCPDHVWYCFSRRS